MALAVYNGTSATVDVDFLAGTAYVNGSSVAVSAAVLTNGNAAPTLDASGAVINSSTGLKMTGAALTAMLNPGIFVVEYFPASNADGFHDCLNWWQDVTHRYCIFADSGNLMRWVDNGAGSDSDFPIKAAALGANHRAVLAHNATGYKMAVDGSSVLTGTRVVSTASQFYICWNDDFGGFVGGTNSRVRRIMYFPVTTFVDADLTALSVVGTETVGGSSGTLYTLTAAQGSYTQTGQAANLLRGRTIIAAQGSYVQTGVAANLVYGRKLAADAGSYALTGQDAGLTSARTMAAAQGSYALTGSDATLTYSAGAQTYTLNAAAGSYSLTGADAGLAYGRVLAAASGAYTLSGVDAGFRASYSLAADAATYTLAGQAATLIYSAGATNYSLTAAPGAYALSGVNADLAFARVMSAASASYSLTGVSAGLFSARTMPAAVGAYALSGVAAALRSARQMAAAPAAYSLSGLDASFARGLTLSAAQGAYAYSGSDAALTLVSGASYSLTAGPGAYTASGQAASFRVSLSIAAARGSYALSGKPADLIWSGAPAAAATAKVPREILVPGLNDKNPARVNTAIRQIVERLGEYAKLDSPVLSGDPEAPTPDLGDNSESIATTAFVKGQGYATAAYVDSENDAQDTIIAGKANAVHTHAIADVTNLQTTLDGKEPAIAAGTSSQYWRGDKTWATISQKLIAVGYTEYTTYTSVTSTIPYDNTPPLNTEGTQIMSLTVTTTSATQKVRLLSTVMAYVFSGSNFTAALFQGSTCVHAASGFFAAEIGVLTNQVEVTPGAAGSYTFTVRVGGSSANTTYLNGTNSGQLFGGVSKCTLSAQVFEP